MRLNPRRSSIESLESRRLLAFSAAIQFLAPTGELAPGFRADGGAPYSTKRNKLTYGWNKDNTKYAASRADQSVPAEQRSLVHLQRKGTYYFELEVPVGAYDVEISAGDSDYTDSTHRFDVEGTPLMDFTPTSNKRFNVETARDVFVSDGRLTIRAAEGSANTKINYLRVTEVAPGSTPPAVSIAATDNRAGEGGNPGVFRISRTGSTADPLAVSFRAGGGAFEGVDYPKVNSPITIPAGQSFVDVPIVPIDDAFAEQTETITWVINPSDAYTTASPTNAATIKVSDNDATPDTPVVTIRVVDGVASEPGTGEGAGLFEFRRTGSTASALTLDVIFGGRAKAGVDYVASPSGSVVIPAGQLTAQYTIAVIDDYLVEGNETVTWQIRQSANWIAPTGSDIATFRIIDDDPANPPTPTVSVSPATPITYENVPASPGRFQLIRDGWLGTALTINFTIGGTATSGSDYQSISPLSATIPVGATVVDIPVVPIDDSIDEPDQESVVLTISPSGAYNVGSPSSATVQIWDDDEPAVVLPVVAIEAIDNAASEGGDTGTFRFSRTGSTAAALTLNLTIGGKATKDVDYADSASVVSTITIPAGQSSRDVTITPINDSTYEGTESVTWVIDPSSNYTVQNGFNSATIQIADNDPNPDAPFSNISWTSAPTAGSNFSEATGAVVDNVLYRFSGFNSSFVPQPDVWKFNGTTWTKLKNAPYTFTHVGHAVDGNTVWFVGGYIGNGAGGQIFGTTQVWKYDTTNDTWSQGPSLPAARAGGTAGIVGRFLYYAGGENLNRTQDTTTVYRLNLDNPGAGWTTRASMPQSRNHAASFTYNDKLYIIGGQTGFDANSVCKTDIQIYDPVNNTWQVAVQKLPAPRSHISNGTIFYRGKVIIVGGNSAHNVAVRTVYALDPATLTTTTLNQFPDTRFSAVAGIINGRMIVNGGYSGAIRSTSYWGDFIE
jgi:N-acetylneuraminic acid mutarotase